MTLSWRSAYTYAKASGMLSKSFLGSRAKTLASAENVRELYGLCFGQSPPDLPEGLLLQESSKAIRNRLFFRYAKISQLWEAGGSFALKALEQNEFANAKRCLRALRKGQENIPELLPSLTTRRFNIEAYPDVKAMFRGSSLAWLAEEPATTELWRVENRLDLQCYAELFSHAARLKGAEAQAALSLLAFEARIRNFSWAMRLKHHFGMQKGEILAYLISAPRYRLERDALQALDLPGDRYEAWAGFRLKGLINQPRGEAQWTIDPAYIETAAEAELGRRLRRSFRIMPGSQLCVYSFLRLLEREGRVMASAFEALRLGMPQNEYADFLEALG